MLFAYYLRPHRQRWLAEQCRFEFVLFVLFEAEQNKAIVRKLPNRTDPLFCSCSSRTEQVKALRSSVRDEHEQNRGAVRFEIVRDVRENVSDKQNNICLSNN